VDLVSILALLAVLGLGTVASAMSLKRYVRNFIISDAIQGSIRSWFHEIKGEVDA
jgi:hypothetical protein